MSSAVARPEAVSADKSSSMISSSAATSARVSSAFLAGLAVVYLLQTATQLRLDTDAVRYLTAAASLADGNGLPRIGVPLGYAVLIGGLDRIGLGSVAFIVALNCIFLAVGMLAIANLLRDASSSDKRWVVIFSLLSLPIVRSVAMPLPEAAFFGTSLASVLIMTLATKSLGRRRVLLLIAAALLAAVAVALRTVGIALAPALVWSLYLALRSQGTRKPVFLGIAVCGLAIITTAAVLFDGSAWLRYVAEGLQRYSYGNLAPNIYYRARSVFQSIGEIAVNIPANRFPSLHQVFSIIGILATIPFFPRSRREMTPARVYMISYMVILLLWPFSAIRLWMPIVPLLISDAWLARAGRDTTGFRLVASRAYLGWFMLTGAAAIAYTTRISLARKNFSRVYGKSGGMALPIVKVKDPAYYDSYNSQVVSLTARYGKGGIPHDR